MNRMSGGNRSRMGLSDNRGMRNYSGPGSRQGGGHDGPGVLGSSPASLMSQGMGGHSGGYGMSGGFGVSGGGSGLGGASGLGGGSSFDFEMPMDSLIQQRSLQQQLSLRESQLALANSLLQQQQSLTSEPPRMGMRGSMGMSPLGGGLGGMSGSDLARGSLMNKRRPDLQSDFQPFMKRPRTDQPRDRYRGRDNDGDTRGSNYRRNQSSSSSRPYRSSDRDSTAKGRTDSEGKKEEYDPENPTADDDEKKGKSDRHHCYVCNVNCHDDDGFSRHMNSKRHKECMLNVLSIHKEKSCQIKTQLLSREKAEQHLRYLEDEEKKRSKKVFCKVCNISDDVPNLQAHFRTQFHKKRSMQVIKGCGWCGVKGFANFSEVLEHRKTEEHQKNQEIHEKDKNKNTKNRRDLDKSRDSKKGVRTPEKRREPIRVEMPESLAKFNPETAVGQSCVVSVSGWFCKLCNKFYNNETAAKDSHCKTEPHFTKYKRFIYLKLKEKAEAEREAAEKAAAEEEAKKKAAAEEEEKSGAADKEDVEMKAEGEEEEHDEENGDAKKEEEEEEKEGEDAEKGEGGGDKEAQDDNAALASDADASNLDLMDDDMEAENQLLNETTYQTAEDETLEGDSTADPVDGEEQGISLVAEANASHFLQDSSQEEADASQITEGDVSVEGEKEEEEAKDNDNDGDKKRATRAAVNTSPNSSAASGRGRDKGAATGKARRGRKAAK